MFSLGSKQRSAPTKGDRLNELQQECMCCNLRIRFLTKRHHILDGWSTRPACTAQDWLDVPTQVHLILGVGTLCRQGRKRYPVAKGYWVKAPINSQTASRQDGEREKSFRRTVNSLEKKSDEPLTTATFDSHSNRLGVAMGLSEKLSQYCYRRGVAETVDSE